MAEEAPLGYESEVHTSMLEPVLLFKQVPYVSGIANVCLTLMMVVGGLWLYLLVGILIHVGLMLMTRTDHQRIDIAARVMMYRSYYGTKA